MLTKIDSAFFQNRFELLTGGPFVHGLPETYEHLFEKQDPDQWQNRLQWLLKIYDEQFTSNRIAVDRIETESTIFHYGNLSIEGDFHPPKHLYVFGNLTVTGILYGEIHRAIVVNGDLQCHGMLLTRTYLFVAGNLFVQECMLQHSYSFTMLVGRLNTLALIEDATCVVCDAKENPLEIEKSNDSKIVSLHRLHMDEVDHEELIRRVAKIAPNYSARFDDGQWDFYDFFKFITND